jgi:hypothetical protein
MMVIKDPWVIKVIKAPKELKDTKVNRGNKEYRAIEDPRVIRVIKVNGELKD